MNDNEIVYIMTNPAMSGLVKIGRTSGDPEARARELSKPVGVPLPFKVYYACTVRDADQTERQLHTIFEARRVNLHKEFFKIAPDKVRKVLELAAIEDVTPPDEPPDPELDSEDESVVPNRPPKPPFTFREVDIRDGATLTFLHDKTITATVAGDRQISFRGQLTSLSAAATAVLSEKKRAGTWSQGIIVQGPAVWCYKGETLKARRERLEQAPTITTPPPTNSRTRR